MVLVLRHRRGRPRRALREGRRHGAANRAPDIGVAVAGEGRRRGLHTGARAGRQKLEEAELVLTDEREEPVNKFNRRSGDLTETQRAIQKMCVPGLADYAPCRSPATEHAPVATHMHEETTDGESYAQPLVVAVASD